MSKTKFSIYFFCICFYLIGVIAGILLFLKGEKSIVDHTLGLSIREFLYAQNFSVNTNTFFLEILKWRIGFWGFLVLFYGRKEKNIAWLFLFFFLGIGSGILVEQLTVFYGLRGIFLFFLLEFPHFFFYSFSYLILVNPKNNLFMFLASYIILMVGCLMECYVNPILLYHWLII